MVNAQVEVGQDAQPALLAFREVTLLKKPFEGEVISLDLDGNVQEKRTPEFESADDGQEFLLMGWIVVLSG